MELIEPTLIVKIAIEHITGKEAIELTKNRNDRP